MQVPNGPKGTRDFYPEEMCERERIFASWHRTCRRYGFEQFDAPMFEHLDLYTQKSGAEIEKQLYAFTDKGGRQISLRPELTPSLARMVASRGNALAKPIRWYSIPRLFRYERMQRGRHREFFQLNMDILGIAEVSADAELIAASIAMMNDLGLDAADFGVYVSSRLLLEQYLAACGVTPEQAKVLYALLDRKAKISPEQYGLDLAAAVPDSRMREAVGRVLAVSSLEDLAEIDGSMQSLAQLRELLKLLEMYGMSEYVVFDIGIVRGLAYYTGIVFELLDRKRSLRAIAGGGRYDRLVETYGGPPTPAVGFAAGDSVLSELMKDKGMQTAVSPRSDVFVACFEERYPQDAIMVTQILRAAGISAEYALRPASVTRQMKQANTARASLVVFAGGGEAAENSVKIKQMNTGEERVTHLDLLTATIRELLSAGGNR